MTRLAIRPQNPIVIEHIGIPNGEECRMNIKIAIEYRVT